MDIKEEGLIKGDLRAHWYYRAKLAALRRMISLPNLANILDVGAGSGFFSGSLLETTSASAATCVDPGYTEDRNEIRMGKPLTFRRSIDESDADLVLLMDVLEHVEDDVGLVRTYAAKVRPGTQFIVTVPAFMWLWSNHDVFLEHMRRYDLASIERVMREGGLTIDRGCYFYGALLPLAAVSRGAERLRQGKDCEPRSQMRDFSAPLNTVLWSLCRAELPLFRANRLAGLTAFVRAVK